MRSPAATPSNRGYRWIILGIVYFCLVVYGVSFQSLPPILGPLSDDLRLSPTQAGVLISLYALPGIFLAIPVGLLADRWKSDHLIILCLVSMIVGSLLVAGGQSFPVLAVGRVLAGIGGVSLFIVGPRIIAHWFSERELGTAAGVYSTSFPVGTIVALNTLGAIAARVGWRGAVLATVALIVLALAVFVALYKPAPSSPRLPARASLTSALHLGLPIWLVGAVWMLFNAAVIAFLAFGPNYFGTQGYGIARAGFLTSILMLYAVPLAPLVGYVLDRVDHSALFMGVGGIMTALGIALIPAMSLPVLASLTLMGVGGALVAPAVFETPPKILRSDQVGTGYGIVSTCLSAGSTLGPVAAGVALDVTGSYGASFTLMAGFALLGSAAAVALSLARR